MKKYLYAAIIICAMLLYPACSDFHTSDNGELDGFWQLTDVDSLDNGHSADVRELKVFWAVQANLLEVRDLRGRHVNVFFRFDHRGNQLTLFDPVADDRDISDSIVTDVSTIWFYGLSHLRETLQVPQLNNGRMTLESERLRMYFRKY